MEYAVDILLILVLVYGAYKGWKYGGISSAISLIGTIIIFILAFYLKNPLSVLLYENLPFFNFTGIFEGISSINILLYEAIAYVLCLIVLSLLLSIIVKITGIFDKIVNLALFLEIPSKIIGLLLGVIQYYIFCYFIVFILVQIPLTKIYIQSSKITDFMMKQTPLLSTVTDEMYHSVSDIYEICIDYDKSPNKQDGDYKALDTLMKYEIISPESVIKLKQKNKLNIANMDELIKKYSKNNISNKDKETTQTTTTEVKENAE